MHASVKYYRNGSEVTLDQFTGGFVEEVIAHVVEQLREPLSKLHCPEHDQYAEVAVRKEADDEVKLAVRGCCENLKQRAEDLVKSVTSESAEDDK